MIDSDGSAAPFDFIWTKDVSKSSLKLVRLLFAITQIWCHCCLIIFLTDCNWTLLNHSDSSMGGEVSNPGFTLKKHLSELNIFSHFANVSKQFFFVNYPHHFYTPLLSSVNGIDSQLVSHFM